MRRMKGCESWRYLFLGIFLGLNILELGDRMKGICLNMFELHLFTSFGEHRNGANIRRSGDHPTFSAMMFKGLKGWSKSNCPLSTRIFNC